MSRVRFLFQWDGRISARQFFIWSFAVGFLSTLASMALLFALIPRDPALGGWPADAKFWSILYITSLPSWISIASLAGRRRHDLGRSAVWLFAIFPYVGILQLIDFMWPSIKDTWADMFLALPMLVVMLWLFGTSGENHDNRFGAVTKSD